MDNQTPLSPLEVLARNHACLCTIGFLIILPLGSLFARYARTFTNQWLYVHWGIQFFIAGPIILTGWVFGYQLVGQFADEGVSHFQDPHQQIGLALLILYLIQVFLGPFIHHFKFRSIFRGHRPPLNYLHVIIGLSILALASYQVHYGLTIEWYNIGAHVVPDPAVNAWLALTIVFWVLYGIGWALLPRQFRLEKEFRQNLKSKQTPI